MIPIVPRIALTALFVALAGLARAEDAVVPATGSAEAAPICMRRSAVGTDYTVCAIDLKHARPSLFWKGADGKPYRTFSKLSQAVAAEGKTLVFAMNAGMYSEDYSPLGLYVENGRELSPVNTKQVKSSGAVPNFYKKPNGIFFLDDKGAAILPTAEYLKTSRKPALATQSGPMLVIDGKINPIFIEGSSDRKYRSGVAVCEDGVVRFAISESRVNFHDFAILFRDELKCADALFLDGGRGSGLYAPALSREDWSGHGGFGPIIGLVE